MTALLVVLGAVAGAPLRYLADNAIGARCRPGVPWGIILVNVAGCGLLGFLAGWPAAPGLMALAGTGFCGTLTTYSTFSYETVRLARSGARRTALAAVAVSLAGGLAAAYAGLAVAHLLAG
ncbi:MAG TPA: CrcB family protein [Streptosporangiaceae bacterium]